MSRYEGWDHAAMRDAGDNANLQSDEQAPSSSFTPINRTPRQPMTPQPSIFTSKFNPTQQSRYEHTPTQLPTPAAPRGRKRGLKQQDQSTIPDDDTKRQKQKRMTHGGRVTKPPFQGVVATTPPSFDAKPNVSSLTSASANNHNHMPTEQARLVNVSSTRPPLKATIGLSFLPLARHPTKGSNRTSSSTTASAGVDLDGEAARHHDFNSQDLMADDEIEDIFGMVEADDVTGSVATNFRLSTNLESHQQRTARPHTDYVFGLPGDDFAKEDLFAPTKVLTRRSSSQPQTASKRQEPAGSRQCNGKTNFHVKDHAPRFTRKFTSPLTEESTNLAEKSHVNHEISRVPIVRPPFPAPVRDRSPIIGLSPNLVLRTCFRIGEAINQASQAAKSGQKIMFELYAKVLISHRDERRQQFVFRDLFHEKPPYMKGVYDAVIWKSVQLYSYDSERLLEAQRICRCIGTIKREGKEWVMVVLNAWEARWEDIAWVEGILRV